MLQCTITRGGRRGKGGICMVGEIKTAYWVPLRLPSAVEGLYVHKSGRKEIRCLTKPHSLLSHAASFLSDAQQDDECWEKYVQVPTKLAVGTGSNATQLDDATSQQRPFPVLEPKKVPMKNHRCGGAVNLQTLAMKLLGGGGKQWGRGEAKGTSMKSGLLGHWQTANSVTPACCCQWRFSVARRHDYFTRASDRQQYDKSCSFVCEAFVKRAPLCPCLGFRPGGQRGLEPP